MIKESVKVGDVFSTNNYGDCVVLEYVNHKKVKVKFITTGYETYCAATHLRKGTVKDLYLPSVCGVGYIGEGVYCSSYEGKTSKEYIVWSAMLHRCYGVGKHHIDRYAGRCITVFKEWHNFQNFAAWVVKQPNYNKDGFDLDKDLRIKDSKEYSPDTCSFVPQTLNTLITSNNNKRGSLPVGVTYDKIANKFKASSRNGKGKPIYLGLYPTAEQAFQAYKEYKESLIKQIAKEEYEKGNIIKEVYDNLMIYEVVPFPE